MATKKLEDMSDAELDALLAENSAPPKQSKLLADMSDAELDAELAKSDTAPVAAPLADEPGFLSRLAKNTVNELPMIGGTIGAVGGGVGTFGIGAIPAGAIGAGLGAAAKGLINDYAFGEKDPNLALDITQSAAFGAAGEASGALIGKAAKAALPSIKKGLTKIAAATSGLPEDVIVHYAQNPELINEIIKKYGSYMGEASDELRLGIMNSVKSFRQSANAKISEQLAATSDIKNVAISPMIVQLQAAKRKLDIRIQPNEIAELDRMIKTIYSMADDELRPGIAGAYGKKVSKLGKSISASDAFKIKGLLQDKVTYQPDGAFFNPDSNVGRAYKGAAATVRKQINSVAGDVAEANNQLSQLHNLESIINKNLVTAGKTDTTLMAAGSGANMRNQKNLGKLGSLIGKGSQFVDEAKNISTARSMANPDLISALGTGRSMIPMAVGGGLGTMLGTGVGTGLGVLGGFAATPLGVKGLINYGSKASKLASKIPPYLQKLPAAAAGQSLGRAFGPFALDSLGIDKAQAEQEPKMQGYPISQTTVVPPDQTTNQDAEISANPNISNIEKSKRLNLLRKHGRIYLGN